MQSKPPFPNLEGNYTKNSDHKPIWITKICQAEIANESDDSDDTAIRVVTSVCSESSCVDGWLKKQGFLCISIYEHKSER